MDKINKTLNIDPWEYVDFDRLYSSTNPFLIPNKAGKINQGFAFEWFITKVLDGTRMGGSGDTDIMHPVLGRVECKFIKKWVTKLPDKNGKIVVKHHQNYATFYHNECEGTTIKEKIQSYCKRFDWLVFGVGDMLEGEPPYIEIVSSADAVQFLLGRITSQDNDGLRFTIRECTKGMSGGTSRRLATLIEKGWIIE